MVPLLTKYELLPIGVHLDNDIVRMAQLRSDGSEAVLVAAASAPIPSPRPCEQAKRLDAAARGIQGILKSKVFNGRRAVLALPAEEALVHHIRVPKLKPEQVSQILRIELEKRTPGANTDMVIRYTVAREIAGKGNTQQEMIVIAARREAINRYLTMAEKAGLDVIGIDIEACAVVECFEHLLRREEDSTRAILFIHIGDRSTQVVMTQWRTLAFARNLPMGGDSLDQAVSDGLGVPLEEARSLRKELALGRGNASRITQMRRVLESKLEETAVELMQCLKYYQSVFRDHHVGLAIFVGTQAYDKTVCQVLAKHLNLPAKIGDPLLGIRYADAASLGATLDRREPHPDWVVALGLSLGAVWGR